MEIIKRDKKTLFLRTSLASGTINDEDFSVDLNIDGKALIFTFPEAIYTVATTEIVNEVIKFRDKQKG